MMSATWNSYRFVVAPIFTQSAFRVVGVSCHQSLEVGLVRQLSWPCSQTTGTDIDRCPTVGDHPSSVVHITTTLAHGDVVERVRNGEHKLATLIGFLCLNFVDYFLSIIASVHQQSREKCFSFHTCNRSCLLLVCRAFHHCVCFLPLLFAFAFALVFPSREMYGPAPEYGDAVLTSFLKSQYSTGCTYRRTGRIQGKVRWCFAMDN